MFSGVVSVAVPIVGEVSGEFERGFGIRVVAEGEV